MLINEGSYYELLPGSCNVRFGRLKVPAVNKLTLTQKYIYDQIFDFGSLLVQV